MNFPLFLKITFYLYIIFTVQSELLSQNAFSLYLEQDSVYRFNSSVKDLDSLIKNVTEKTQTDSIFLKTYGTAEVITLEQMIYFALEHNPELKTMRYSKDAKIKLAEERSVLPDPQFEFMMDDVMSNFKKVGMINFYASQMFMYPGKLKTEKQINIQNASMIEYEIREMASDMIRMIKMNYYDLFYINQLLKINAENQLLIKNFLTAAEIKYASGKGMQQEIFKSQIELSKLINDEYSLNQQKKNVLSNLTQLTKTEINEATKINFKDINQDYIISETQLETADENALVSFALSHRADLKALKYKIEMNKSELNLSELNKLPDFMLKVGYKILPYEDMNAFSFMVGFNIPLAPWSSDKYTYSVQKNSFLINAAVEEYNAKSTQIRNEITNILNNLKTLKKTISYYHNVVIPQTENSLKATQYSYESDMTSFLDLLDSYRMLNEAKIMYYESINMYLRMMSELEKAVGLNLKN